MGLPLAATAQETQDTEAASPPDTQTQEQSPAQGETQSDTSTDVAPTEPAGAETQTPLADKDQAKPVETIPVSTEPATKPTSKDATVLDTIEVTADKRVKAQRDLPGSVGAIRGETLEKIQAQGMSDYMKLIPGVSLIDFGGNDSTIIIRGIAASANSGFTGNTTGIYVDEMPFADLFAPQSSPDLNPFDLERVEVLKGPQGTLFGSGALAGAIRYILQKPNHSVWQTKVATTMTQTKYADDLAKVGALAQNVPLFGDSAALRVVVLYREDPGTIDAKPAGTNTRDEKDVNSLDQLNGRVLGSWNVSDSLKVSGFVFGQKTRFADQVTSRNRERPERNNIPFPSPRENSFGGVNLVGDYALDTTRLLYTGTHLRKETYSEQHQEGLLVASLAEQQDTEWYNLIIGDVTGQTHELRWSSQDGGDGNWEWLAGAAYMNYVQHIFQFQPNPGPANQGYYANPPKKAEEVPEQDRATSFLFATIDGDGTETAVFGEATRKLGERWEVTLGGRQYETDLVADTALAGGQISALFPGETTRRDRHRTGAKGFNPKVALRYLHDNNMQLNWLVAKGFQFGGFQLNPPAPGFEASADNAGFHFGPYKSSTLWNYETSLRTEWLDRRLRFDLTLFYQDWTDLQLTLALPVNPEPLPEQVALLGIPENVTFGTIVNVGSAHSEGLEVALEVLPFPGATFSSSAAWISALTDEPFDFANADGPVPAGTRLPGTPRFQWANQFSYQSALPYFSSWNSTLSLIHSHIGSSPGSIRNEGVVGGYDTLDLRLSFIRPISTYLPQVNLGMNNLTDVRGWVAAEETSTDGAYIFVRPRTALLSLAWSF